MLDHNLNDAREFLIGIIKDQNNPKRTIELSFKILMILGQVRSNVEDLLIVATLLEKFGKEQVDLSIDFHNFKSDNNLS